MIKKIIITGASSAIMNAVIELILLEEKYKIVGVTRKQQQNHRNDIEWVENDITSDRDYLFLKDADLLIHAAAVSNAVNKEEYFKTNYEATCNLLKAATKYKVNRFIYISSIVSNEHSGYYGQSKLKSEKFIKNTFDNWLIIRPSQLYGYSDKAPIDSLIKQTFGSLL